MQMENITLFLFLKFRTHQSFKHIDSAFICEEFVAVQCAKVEKWTTGNFRLSELR